MPISNAAFSSLAKRLSARMGRVQTLLLLRASSIALLVAMAAVSMHLRSAHTLQGVESEWTRRAVVAFVLALHLMRSALANCTTPISTSISMDFVPSHTRARWSSSGSVVQACWSGSAALGGVLADRYGYPFVFVLTAVFQSVGTLIQATLLPIVPKKE